MERGAGKLEAEHSQLPSLSGAGKKEGSWECSAEDSVRDHGEDGVIFTGGECGGEELRVEGAVGCGVGGYFSDRVRFCWVGGGS